MTEVNNISSPILIFFHLQFYTLVWITPSDFFQNYKEIFVDFITKSILNYNVVNSF